MESPAELFSILQTKLDQITSDEYIRQRHMKLMPPQLLLSPETIPATDDQETMIQKYRSYQLQKPGENLTLFEKNHLETHFKRTWSRLEPELQINRLLVYLQSLPDLPLDSYQSLKKWLLKALFNNELRGERVVYEGGRIVEIKGLVREADGTFRWRENEQTPVRIVGKISNVSVITQIIPAGDGQMEQIFCQPVSDEVLAEKYLPKPGKKIITIKPKVKTTPCV